jgi:hypothetical protein
MSDFVRSKKDGHNYNTDSINLPNQIKSIVLDFEHMIYEINGKGIGLASDVDISFHDGVWNVQIGLSRPYNKNGTMIFGKSRISDMGE